MVALSSNPSHAGFVSGRTWEGVFGWPDDFVTYQVYADYRRTTKIYLMTRGVMCVRRKVCKVLGSIFYVRPVCQVF